MRAKETSEDYRYFPEPDLPPLRIDPAWLEGIGRSMPELPSVRRQRYREQLGLSAYDADVIVGDLAATALFDAARAADVALPPKKVANWVIGESLRLARAEGGEASGAAVDGAQLAALVRMVEEGTISGTSAKEVLGHHARTGRPVAELVAELGLGRISDRAALRAAVAQVIAEQPGAVGDVRAGAERAIGFLIGQVMRRTGGRADPSLVGELLRAALVEAEPAPRKPD
jgi:aspartyl-tRNA(Asn)/glutamyl-tRNA(Gln) amidotransferase subunit B